jgi:hypothetical protein
MRAKRAGGMDQSVEYPPSNCEDLIQTPMPLPSQKKKKKKKRLPSKHEALSSNPSAARTTKKTNKNKHKTNEP